MTEETAGAQGSKPVWIITRHLVEKMCGSGDTRKEAMENAENPFSIIITSETCVKEKP